MGTPNRYYHTPDQKPHICTICKRDNSVFCSDCEDYALFEDKDDTKKPVDMVNQPPHYTDGSIEVIDYIADKFDIKSFCLGNAIKYISRAGKKNNEVEDLRKAIWYINHYIEVLTDER